MPACEDCHRDDGVFLFSSPCPSGGFPPFFHIPLLAFFHLSFQYGSVSHVTVFLMSFSNILSGPLAKFLNKWLGAFFSGSYFLPFLSPTLSFIPLPFMIVWFPQGDHDMMHIRGSTVRRQPLGTPESAQEHDPTLPPFVSPPYTLTPGSPMVTRFPSHVSNSILRRQTTNSAPNTRMQGGSPNSPSPPSLSWFLLSPEKECSPWRTPSASPPVARIFLSIGSWNYWNPLFVPPSWWISASIPFNPFFPLFIRPWYLSVGAGTWCDFLVIAQSSHELTRCELISYLNVICSPPPLPRCFPFLLFSLVNVLHGKQILDKVPPLELWNHVWCCHVAHQAFIITHRQFSFPPLSLPLLLPQSPSFFVHLQSSLWRFTSSGFLGPCLSCQHGKPGGPEWLSFLSRHASLSPPGISFSSLYLYRFLRLKSIP